MGILRWLDQDLPSSISVTWFDNVGQLLTCESLLARDVARMT